MSDYESERLKVWPENMRAVRLFSRVCWRWHYPAMGGAPLGLRWAEVYPIMDRMSLDEEAWNDLAEDAEVMEAAALGVLKKRAEEQQKR